LKKQYLISAKIKHAEISNYNDFPFSLDFIKNLSEIEFHPNVTFIIGDNGIGKSTLLEAIALAYGLNPEGGSKSFNFSTKDTHSILYNYLRLIKGVIRPKDSFFLRGDNIYNISSEIDNLSQIDNRILQSYGGKSLHLQSHGESFLSIFLNRFGGNGLYLIDEPETALSITSQMALLSRIHQLVQQNSQFIICTHSPIVLSYPQSKIYQIDKNFISTLIYEETNIYALYKAFILNKEEMLKELL